MIEKKLNMLIFNNVKVSFEEMLEIEFNVMLNAALNKHILFYTYESNFMNDYLFLSLN